MMRRNLLANAYIQLVTVFGILIGVNLWSYDHFTRIDLTEDRLYSLELQTRAIVHRVDKPLLTKVYISEGLCYPHQNHRDRIVDMLEELRAYSHGLMEIEVVDPTGNPEQIDQASRFGIEPFEGQYSCDDRQETREVFLGISMLYGDRQEVLTPILDLDRLEYDLAVILKRLITGEEPVRIGWSTGHRELPLLERDILESMVRLRTELAREYILEPVRLGGAGQIDESIDMLFVVEPKTTLGDRALYQIDQFLMRGGAAAIHLTNYAPSRQAPGRAQRFNHGLEPLLAHYGVQVNRDILVDRSHYQLRTPLAPEIRTFDPEHIAVSTIDSALFPYASSLLVTDPESERVRATILARTEPTSGAIREIEWITPEHYELVDPTEERGSFPVLVALEGTWTSYFADREIPLPENVPGAVPDDPSDQLRESLPTRLVVGSSSSAVWFGETNQQLTRNLADWMAEDESLIAIRGKTHDVPVFDPPETEASAKLKRTNLIGGIGFMLSLGLCVWLFRHRPWDATVSDVSFSDRTKRWFSSSTVGKTAFSGQKIREIALSIKRVLMPRKKTLALLVLLLFVSTPSLVEHVDFFESESDTLDALNGGLPVIPAVPREDISRIEITRSQEQIILEQEISSDQRERRELGIWTIRSPIEARADTASIRTLVAAFRREIPIDARLESGNLEDYGLDANNRIVVEVFTSDETPALAYTIGFDVSGSDGSTYVKLPDSDEVYRANIGGRVRFQRQGSDWRNRVVLGYEVDELRSLVVNRNGNRILGFHRVGEEERWMITEAPEDMVLDQERIGAAMERLGNMRAGAFLGEVSEGFDPPLATFEIELSDGRQYGLEVASGELEGAAIVRRADSMEAFQVSDSPIEALMLSIADYEDRTLFRFHRDDVETLQYREGSVNITIRQDDGTTNGVPTWIPVNPANYSLELRRTWYMVNTLASLEGDERSTLTPEEAGIPESRNAIRITFANGTYQDLIIGRATRNRRGGPAWFVCVNGTGPVFLIGDSLLSTLKAGFGR